MCMRVLWWVWVCYDSHMHVSYDRHVCVYVYMCVVKMYICVRVLSSLCVYLVEATRIFCLYQIFGQTLSLIWSSYFS